jgi:hypothetical protein
MGFVMGVDLRMCVRACVQYKTGLAGRKSTTSDAVLRGQQWQIGAAVGAQGANVETIQLA